MEYNLFGNSSFPNEDMSKCRKRCMPRKSHYRARIDSFYHPEILEGIAKTEKFGMPIIQANTINPNTSVTTPFDRIGSKSVSLDSLVMFYVHDYRFHGALNHPWDYTQKLLSYTGVIGPDLSQYIDMDYATRLYHNYWNKACMAYWQVQGVNIYPNVTWSLPDSYEYSIEGLPQNSIIAINSMGVLKYDFSKALWLKGYNYVVERLHPSLILRYGPIIEGEYKEISQYLTNFQLKKCEMGANGSKASGDLEFPNKREFKEVFFISKNIEVVQLKDDKKRVRLPEESRTANRVYVVFNKDGTLKSIGRYGSDCLKVFEIHFDHEHDGMTPHYHKWVDKGGNARGPETKGTGKHSKTVAHPLTKGMLDLYYKVKNYAP